MAKTSRSHPLSPPPARPRAKVTNRHRSPSARYKAGYASSPPMPNKDAPDLRKRPPDLRKRPPKKQKVAKDPAVLPDKHAPVPQDLRKSPPENNFMTTILMPVGAYASKRMLPNTSAQETPTLPAIQIQEQARYPTRGNRTPAPEPPKVIGCPPCELMTGDDGDGDGLSTTFSEEEESDGDDVCNTFDEVVDVFDDDDLFYSDDELDEEFERELDEVARAIEYSDHKKFNHRGRRTTLIVGGPMAPNYEGKSDAEKASLKKEWES